MLTASNMSVYQPVKQKNLFDFVLIFLIANTMPDEAHFYSEEELPSCMGCLPHSQINNSSW